MPQPERVLSQAVAAIQGMDEAQHKEWLLAALMSLLPNEEISKMVEQFLEQNDELLNTPYLRKMRRIGWEKGLQEGREAGREEGREEALREAILGGIIQRFNPPASEYRAVEEILVRIEPSTALRQLLMALFDAADFAAFWARVQEAVAE